MTIKEAYEKMAMLMKAEYEFYYKNMLGDLNFPGNKSGAYGFGGMEGEKELTEQEKNLIEEKRRLHIKVERFGEELAGHPLFFDIVMAYMVDAKGFDEPQEGKIEGFLSDPTKANVKDLVNSTGPLAQQVRAVIEANGFDISDSGGGCGGWHLGVPCNEPNSRRVCSLLHLSFKSAIESGLLKIQRHHWGYRLPGLGNWNALEKYCQENGIPLSKE